MTRVLESLISSNPSNKSILVLLSLLTISLKSSLSLVLPLFQVDVGYFLGYEQNADEAHRSMQMLLLVVDEMLLRLRIYQPADLIRVEFLLQLQVHFVPKEHLLLLLMAVRGFHIHGFVH